MFGLCISFTTKFIRFHYIKLFSFRFYKTTILSEEICEKRIALKIIISEKLAYNNNKRKLRCNNFQCNNPFVFRMTC